MKTIQRAVAVFVLFFLAPHAIAVDSPGGFKDLLAIDKGNPYHPLFPFYIGGSDYVGVIVIARSPKKVDALFENIDSPGYLNPDSIGKLSVQTDPVAGGKFSSTTEIGAAAALAQLDALSNTAKTTPNAKNLLAQTCEPSSSGSSAQSPTGTQAAVSAGNNPSASTTSGSSASTASGSQTSENCQQSSLTTTGIDFSKFSGGTVTVSGAHVAFYTLDTLKKLQSSDNTNPLGALGKQVFTDDKQAWVISRVIIADSVTYDLTTTTDLDAGLFAKLTAWLPTLSAKYKSHNIVSITCQSPVVVGYKLWRPNKRVEGSSVGKTGEPGTTLDAPGIEKLFTLGGN